MKNDVLEYSQQVQSPLEQYKIHVAGTLDSFNTSIYKTLNNINIREESKFEPNKQLVIENLDSKDLVNPRVFINNRRNRFSIQTILGEIISENMSDKEKAFSLFNYMKRTDIQAHNNRLRVGPLIPDISSNSVNDTFKERANPVKALNFYYCSGCVHSSVNLAILANAAGLKTRVLKFSSQDNPYDKNHAATEIYYEGEYHLFDAELRAFFLDKDNVNIASYETICKFPKLINRTHLHGPQAHAFNTENCFKFLFKKNETTFLVPFDNWLSTMELTLRPFEKIIYNWDHISKYRYEKKRFYNHPGVPYNLANGQIIYSPKLRESGCIEGIFKMENISFSFENKDKPSIYTLSKSLPSFIVYKIESPYPIVGSTINTSLFRKSHDDEIKISISYDTLDWVEAATIEKIGSVKECLVLDNILNPLDSPAIYKFYVMLSLNPHRASCDTGIEKIQFTTDLQMMTMSLPSLSHGDNNVTFKHDSSGPRKARISHKWTESSESLPPQPPRSPINLPNKSMIDAKSLVKISWKPSTSLNNDNISTYHIIVSDRKDFLMAISPNFDRLTFSSDNTWEVPQGWLREGVTYYWKVRCRNDWGAWSKWSNIWSFTTKKDKP